MTWDKNSPVVQDHERPAPDNTIDVCARRSDEVTRLKLCWIDDGERVGGYAIEE